MCICCVQKLLLENVNIRTRQFSIEYNFSNFSENIRLTQELSKVILFFRSSMGKRKLIVCYGLKGNIEIVKLDYLATPKPTTIIFFFQVVVALHVISTCFMPPLYLMWTLPLSFFSSAVNHM